VSCVPKIVKIGSFSPSYSKYKRGGAFFEIQCIFFAVLQRQRLRREYCVETVFTAYKT